MTTRNALKLGTGRMKLIVEPELDRDAELELYTDEGDCDWGNHYFFLTVADLIKLRDHIDAVLADGKTHQ